MSKSNSSQLNESLNYSIEELMAKKLRYIEKLEFEKARDVENLIQEKRQNDNKDIFERTKEEFEQKVEVFYQEFLNNCENIKENANEAEMNIRESADESFKDLRDRHIEELTRLEKEYSLEIIRARRKIVPEQLEQQRRAKELAKANDFEGAVRLRMLAEKIYEQEHIIRRQEIVKKYDALKDQIFERQKNDLLNLNNKLNEAIEKHNQTIDKDIKSKEKLLMVSILAAKQKCTNAMTGSIQVPEVKRSLSEKFDKFANEKVEEITGFTINQNQSPSKTPTKTPRSQTKQSQQQRSQFIQSPTPTKTAKMQNDINSATEVFDEEEDNKNSTYDDNEFNNSHNDTNFDDTNNNADYFNNFINSNDLLDQNEEEENSQIDGILDEDENNLMNEI